MKNFTTQEIRDLLNQVYHEEFSFSRMVEILNEMVSEADKKCVEDIPKRKFKEGDKVQIKEGISSKTHDSIGLSFVEEMDELIGTTMTVYRYTDGGNYVECEGIEYAFLEEWLEPYVEELKEGDLAIFWDGDKRDAYIRICDHFNGDEYLTHGDHHGLYWLNAIKFESKEQFELFIKGEI